MTKEEMKNYATEIIENMEELRDGLSLHKGTKSDKRFKSSLIL